MKIKSFNIFGITGGIGHSFFNEIKKSKSDICGFYHSNDNLASQIKREYPEVLLKKVDLSSNFAFEGVVIPNYEGLLYVAGKAHFGKRLFDFNEEELQTHMNININSLFVILQKLCSYNDAVLKKIVVVSSIYPSIINSLYHTVKRLQDEFLRILRHALNNKQIGLSIVKVGWVNTNLYREYIRVTGKSSKKVIEPNIVARYCVQEFEQNKLFNLRECKS